MQAKICKNTKSLGKAEQAAIKFIGEVYNFP
jgi:hypothetical protein